MQRLRSGFIALATMLLLGSCGDTLPGGAPVSTEILSDAESPDADFAL